jgi:hypothetical protein
MHRPSVRPAVRATRMKTDVAAVLIKRIASEVAVEIAGYLFAFASARLLNEGRSPKRERNDVLIFQTTGRATVDVASEPWKDFALNVRHRKAFPSSST